MTKMKLVPAEPTDEMEAASDSYADRNITDSFYDCWSDAYGYDIYEAMVTAAPKGGKVSREVVGQIEDALYKLWSDELSEQDVLSRILEALGLEVEE